MAEIAPIRGVLYDPSRVDASRVLAPPYDVISEADRAKLEAQDPHNCVRLVLPRGEGDTKYSNAAKILQSWRDEGTLVRDMVPALYRYHQVFTHPELGPNPVTRRGFIAGVRLHDFDEGIIKPHERTLRGPKEDRLKLMRATSAHFSQIFTLYSDPQRETDRAFAAAETANPHLEGTTADGTLHRLWRVTDETTQKQVAFLLRDAALYIADGHHRYETMLALRAEYRAKQQMSRRAAPEFGTLFLANMDDPGLVVLPTHRLVHSLPSFDLERLLAGAASMFSVEELSGLDAKALRVELALRSTKQPTFAALVPGGSSVWFLSLRVSPRVAGLSGSEALTSLDVTLLHSLILEKLLGIDRQAQEAQQNITYVKDTKDALARIARGEAQVGFLLHPTRVDQVRAVADAKEVMPQKSTFFYPKIASGLVVNPLDPREELPFLS